MLTGEVIFTNRDHPNYHRDPGSVIFELSAQCNLDVVERGEQWQDVGQRPKDFIKRLLVLDEVKRMNIKQALAHSWFTHRSYVKEFEEVCNKAVSAWRPRKQTSNLVEPLQPDQLAPRAKSVPFSNKQAYEASSRFFGPKSAKHSQANAVFMRKRSLNAANFPRIAEENDRHGPPKTSLADGMVTSSPASIVVQPPVTGAAIIQSGISQLALSRAEDMASSQDPIQFSEHSLDSMDLSAVASNDHLYEDGLDGVMVNATPTPCPSPVDGSSADMEYVVPETPTAPSEVERKRSGDSLMDDEMGLDFDQMAHHQGREIRDTSFRQAKRSKVY